MSPRQDEFPVRVGDTAMARYARQDQARYDTLVNELRELAEKFVAEAGRIEATEDHPSSLAVAATKRMDAGRLLSVLPDPGRDG